MILFRVLTLNSVKRLLMSCSKTNRYQQQPLKHSSNSPVLKADHEIDDFINDKEFMHLKNEFLKTKTAEQRILVIQPFVRNKIKNSTPQLMLDETVALAESIPNWKVVHTKMKGLNVLNRYDIFKAQTIINMIEESGEHNVDNIVIGIDWLNGSYQMKLENELKLDVYDRYSMILRIFHQRSSSKESKIQTALAEIPYIRSRLNLFRVNPNHHQASMIQSIGTGGKDYYNKRKFLLDKRENRLKKELEKIENARRLTNPTKRTNKVPMIGIVGYTNSGKSSLIKHFSKNKLIEPQNQLFATLDLTRFKATLNNNQEIFFLDTIGFISNIPKNLLDAFNCTLKEIIDCDLIIHVYDTNHPDLENQKKTVYQTLFDQIEVTEKLKTTMIEVGNKIDLLDMDQFEEFSKSNPEHLFVSITERINLPDLAERMQEALEKNMEFIRRKFKVKTGSEQYEFLVENATVKEVQADKTDPNYSIVDVSISKKSYHHLMNKMSKKE